MDLSLQKRFNEMSQESIARGDRNAQEGFSDFKALASDARPVNDADWGSERQVVAENFFFDQCRKLFPVPFEDGGEFSAYCLKATTEEMLDEALTIVANELGAKKSPLLRP